MEPTFNEFALLWIVLLPLIGAALNGVAGCFFKAEREVVVGVAIGSVALSFILALYNFAHLFALKGDGQAATITYQVYEWFSIQLAGGATEVPINVRFTMDSLSGLMTVMVTGIGLLIHVYSAGYMEEEPSYARFFAYLNLFMASMLILVLASNLPLMFVGWEGVGVCSYLLIGFWFSNPSYAAAGKKAFIYNRIGDFGVIMGMFILLAATGSFEFAEINAQAASLADNFTMGSRVVGISIATLACLFLFLGCTGKSAQIPLFVWLPDAMAGPTPVSALIHAATMVTAGVYLCCRLSPVFVQSPTAMTVIAIVGTLTALVAAAVGLVQTQLKRVLAYSTVSQLGFMFAAVGVGAFGAGIFHVFTHAFFKACLFLSAGSVMHAVHAHGDADLAKLGNMKEWMPRTRIAFMVSCYAIAGLPLGSGFFSKDEILVGALYSGDFLPAWVGYFVTAGLLAAAAGTAFYMYRLYYLTFTGEYRGEAHPHESPETMTIPLLVLAAGAAVVGFLGLPHHAIHALEEYSWWGHWMEPSLGKIPTGEHGSTMAWAAMGLGTAAAVGGWFMAMQKYKDQPWTAPTDLSPFHQLLMDKWRVDELYEFLLIKPGRVLARWLGYIDRTAVDGLTKLAAMAVQGGGWLLTRAQTGVMHVYGAIMVAGFLLLTTWVLYPHPHLDSASKGDAVHFVAGEGFGYEYRWDFDTDGEMDTEWGQKREGSFAYDAEDHVGLVLVLTHGPVLGLDPYTLELSPGDTPRSLNPRFLGPGWQTNPEDSRPPSVKFDGEKLLVYPNGSTIRVNGQAVDGNEIPVAAGSSFEVGQFARLRVDALVRGTVEVRSVFGHVRSESVDVQITPKAGSATASATEAVTTEGRLARAGGAR